MVHDRVVGVAGYVEDARLGARLGQSARQLATTRPGHHNIRDQQVNRALTGPRHRERLVRTLRVEHRVAELREQPLGERTQDLVVFSEEDRLRAGERRRLAGRRMRLRRGIHPR